MKQPSTDWREVVAPDEAQRFAAQAAKLAEMHRALSARLGKGRLLHRKAVASLRGQFEVLPDLPMPARHGLFAAPGTYPALVRLSNGAAEVQPNSRADIRGFAIKVNGVDGPSSLEGRADHQDFVLINHASFASRRSDDFVDLVVASSRGQAAVLWHLLRTLGPRAALAKIKGLAAVIGKPFQGFAAEAFYSALPLAVGPYAAKLRLLPTNPAPAGQDFGEDVRQRVNAGALVYELALQFFVDEATTPIEDPTAVWPEAESPFVTVARLSLQAEAGDVEALRFDPWGGLEAHRPLGEIMRARKGAYYVSQQQRGAAG